MLSTLCLAWLLVTGQVPTTPPVAPPAVDSPAVASPAAGSPDAAAPPKAASATELRVAVDVNGVTGERRDNVLSALSIRQAQVEKTVLSAAAVAELHDSAQRQIERALEPFGYYRPMIDASLERSNDRWRARYDIAPGPQVALEAVELTVEGEGQDDPAFVTLTDTVPLASGVPLNHQTYEQAKSAFLTLAAERGYFEASFATNEVKVDLDRYAADVELRFATGPRYSFGEVTFLQDAVEPSLLEGYVSITVGEPYEAEQLRLMQASLQGSDLWSLVLVNPRRDLVTDGRVPIEITLTPRPRRRDAVGLGFSTDTGPRITGVFDFRRLNRAGHRAQIDLKLSELDRSGGFRYIIPRAETAKGIVRIEGGYEERKPDSNDNVLTFVGTSLARLRGRSRHVYSLRQERHEFVVATDQGTTDLLVPGFSWSRTEADDRVRPRRGHRIDFQVRGGASSVLSDVSFVWVSLRGKLIRSLSPRWRVLGRVDTGATWTSRFAALPPSLRFFAGGDESIRGFGFQDLGPQDAAGNVRGGDLLLVASAELEARLFRDWGAAVFLDAGNAFNDFDRGKAARGTGVGIRWFSPIGTLRADVAWALSEPGTPVRLHLGLGLEL